MNRLEIHKENKIKKKLSKKVVGLIWAVIIVVAIGACIVLFRPTYIPSSSNAQEKMADSYFNKLLTVDDYHIEKSAVIMYNDENYIQVDFSVKPDEKLGSKWISETDKVKDGWVDGKTVFIRYVKIGKIYFTGISANAEL